jgi:hypothetical protein
MGPGVRRFGQLSIQFLTNVGLGHFSPGTLMVKNVQGVPGHDFLL